jgi:GDP-L-fucose synthase
MCLLVCCYSAEGHVNVGTGGDISVDELAVSIGRVTGFRGDIMGDSDKPDGTILKRMDTTLINGMGWYPSIPFDQGLAKIYAWF